MKTIEFFLKNNLLKKRTKYYFFWNGNKMNGDNNDVLQSGKDRYTTQNFIKT